MASILKRFHNWLESDRMMSWVNPIPMARLEINMRSMCGQSCFWLTTWYNINLLFFRIFGKLKLLGQRQEFYDMCIEHNKKKEGKL